MAENCQKCQCVRKTLEGIDTSSEEYLEILCDAAADPSSSLQSVRVRKLDQK